MCVKDLIEYLQGFDPDCMQIGCLVADIAARQIFDTKEFNLITGYDHPVFAIGIGDPEPFEEEEEEEEAARRCEAAAEEAGQ